MSLMMSGHLFRMREDAGLPGRKLRTAGYCMFSNTTAVAKLLKKSLCLMFMLQQEMEKISTNVCAVVK